MACYDSVGKAGQQQSRFKLACSVVRTVNTMSVDSPQHAAQCTESSELHRASEVRLLESEPAKLGCKKYMVGVT